MRWIHNLLARAKRRKAEKLAEKAAQERWIAGYKAFESGKKHFLAKHRQPDISAQAEKVEIRKALEYFDEAIDCGFEGEGVYGNRGLCLRMLDYDLDAIEDLNRAIALEPEDSNLYYMRSLSKFATRDFEGCVSDLQEAIRLSKVPSALNREYDTWAKETGYSDATAFYEMQLLLFDRPPGPARDSLKSANLRRRTRGINRDESNGTGEGSTDQNPLT